MQDTRRSQGHVLLDARASRGRKAARPDHRRRGRGPRGEVPRVRGPEDIDDAGETRHRGLEEAHLPNHEGERPGQRILEEEAPAFRLEAERGPAAEPARQALRRARAPHPCRRRPDVRAHRAEVELRLSAGRPLHRDIVGHSVGDRRDSGLVKAAFATVGFPPPVRHPGFPYGPRKRVRQRLDRRDARGIRHREVPAGEGLPVRQRRDRVGQQQPEEGLVHRESLPDTEHLRQRVNEWVRSCNNARIHSTLGYMSPVEFREAGLSL